MKLRRLDNSDDRICYFLSNKCKFCRHEKNVCLFVVVVVVCLFFVVVVVVVFVFFCFLLLFFVVFLFFCR